MKNIKNKKLFLGLLASMLISQSASAFDYDVYGGTYVFSKIGFNNKKENLVTGKLPTDSWASMALDLNVKGNFVDGFQYGLGGMLSAPVWDPNKASFAYINGTTSNSQNNNSTADINNRYIVLSNLYLGYEFKGDSVNFGIKGGRFEDHNLDWVSGFTEGAKLYLGFGDYITMQLNWVNRRGLTYNGWFYDFYYVGKKGNGDVNRQFLVGSFDVNVAEFNIKPQVYYHTNNYTAPGLNLSYKYVSDSIVAKTSIYSLFELSHKNGKNSYTNGTNSRLATLLIAQEDMEYDSYKFGFGIWKVFNQIQIGSNGNPSGVLDIWTSNAVPSDINYDSWAKNDINSKNAFTLWLYGGSVIGDFDWRLLGRATTSENSDEQSLALQLGYMLTKSIKLGLKLEWFNDISKSFERIDSKTGIAKYGNSKITNDRSHAFLTAEYTF